MNDKVMDCNYLNFKNSYEVMKLFPLFKGHEKLELWSIKVRITKKQSEIKILHCHWQRLNYTNYCSTNT